MIARFGEFTLDGAQRRLMRGGEDVHLTPKAFDLLALLIDQAPRVVPKAELHERLWPGTFVSDSTLAGLVKELRHALTIGDSETSLIRTAHRVGYAFAGTLESAPRTRSSVRCWVDTGGKRVRLSDGENVIGRDPLSDISLDAAGVSRRHARIVVRSGDAVIEDLGSKNGTMVRDRRVTGSVALCDGDVIRIGPVQIVYRESRVGGASTATVRVDITAASPSDSSRASRAPINKKS